MQLKDAVQKLNDADKAVRDAAMGAVLAARDGAVPALVDALKTPGAAVAKIALLLAALKARDGVAPLVDLVHRGVLDLDTRAVVARAFAELMDGRDAFDDAAKRAVLKLSRDGHVTTRTLSVKALRAIGDTECEARLREIAAADSDLATKKAALEALKELRAAAQAAAPAEPDVSGGALPDGGMALDLEAAVRAQALAARSGSASGPVPVAEPTGPHADIIRRLRDPRWSQKAAAVEDAVNAAAADRAGVVGALAEVLAGRNAGAKIGAAQALARIQAPETARALLDVVTENPVSDDERELRPIALKALACSLTGGEEGFAQPLLPLTRDADPFTRAGALLCLGRLADRVGARAATLALTDPHEHVKEAAAVALSEGTREEDTDLVLPLLAVLGGMPSPSVATREAILLALSRIHVADAAVLLRLRHRVRPSVLGMTSSLRRTAIAILERCYAPDDPPPVGIVDDVLGRLADDHPEVRLLAASFLAQHLEPGLTHAVERIEDALDREERPVSLLCLEALRKHDSAKAKQALEAAAEDPDEAVSARAKELLAGFEPRTEEWQPAAPAAEPAPEPAAAAEPVEAAPGDVVEAPPAVEQPPPLPSRRVRRASGNGEVVEARDPDSFADDASKRLKDRLAALQQAAADGKVRDLEGERAALLERFVGSVPQPRRRLVEELREASGLSEEEKAARRAAIFEKFL